MGRDLHYKYLQINKLKLKKYTLSIYKNLSYYLNIALYIAYYWLLIDLFDKTDISEIVPVLCEKMRQRLLSIIFLCKNLCS